MSRAAPKGGERRLVDAPPVAPALHQDVERFERRDLAPGADVA